MRKRNLARVLVTGGSGFIGSHVGDYLKKLGLEVTVYDRTTKKLWRDDVKAVQGDILDRDRVIKAAASHDGIIHLVGRLGTAETIDNPWPSVEVNISGALNIFEAAKRLRLPVVYISVGNYWMENSYSITKTAAERFAYMYNTEFGTQITVVRGLNAYGERQKHQPVQKIVPTFVVSALQNRPLPIFGSGEQKMDMIYVGDLAKILVEALVREHEIYDRVFDAGTGIAYPVNEIAQMVIKETGSKAGVKHLPMRAGEPENSVVVGNLKTLESLFPEGINFVPFRKGLKKTVAWYRKNFVPD